MTTKISVINFKGGVGKTTLAFHLACHLARSHKVLIIDVDHQSSLSQIVLGSLWEERAENGLTSNRIFESFVKSKVPFPGEEIILQNPYKLREKWWDPYPTLSIVPAQFELDDTEIDLASTTMGGAMSSEWEKRVLLARWLDGINYRAKFDFVIFDCPPATKLVSQNAIAASDYFVIPVIPDEMSSRGVTHFRKLVTTKIDAKLRNLSKLANIEKSEIPKAYTPKTRLAGIVPFLAKTAPRAESGLTNIHTETIGTLRRRWEEDVLDGIVRNMTGVAEAVNDGWPVWNSRRRNATSEVSRMMRGVCEEIEERVS